MSGFQAQVSTDLRASEEAETARLIDITARMSPQVAYQLAQFCKRSTFDQFYELTEAHLSRDERTALAYQMISGIDAVSRALSDAGYSPR